MKKLLILVLFAFASLYSVAQTESIEKILPTETSAVTVYLQGAQIQRKGEVDLKSGSYTVLVKSLSALLDPNSITIKGQGAIKILSVQHQYDYLEKDVNSTRVDSIKSAIDNIETSIRENSNRMSVLEEKESLIAANKELGSENTSSNQLLEMLTLYERELTAIKSEKSKIKINIDNLQSNLRKLKSQLETVSDTRNETKSNILIKLESNESTKASFEISYFVQGAGWYPKYRLNVADITKPIELEYQAEVFQQTGEDWENVKLRFSNAEPNQNKEAPELETWYLDYARFTDFEENNPSNLRINSNSVKGKVTSSETGEALPGVNVLVQGTSIGTITDFQGNYSVTMPKGSDQLTFSFIGMKSKTLHVNSSTLNVSLREDVQQLSEVVVTGYADTERSISQDIKIRGVSSVPSRKQAQRTKATTIKRQTNVEFEVEDLYTIRSGNPQMYIDLKNYEMDAEYHYVAIPKLDKSAYLVAGIANWDQYNLMNGEAKLFFEGSFVGTSILNTNATIDTLKISLGNDKGITVEREKIDDFNRSRFIGFNKYKKLGYKINVRNAKSQTIDLTLYDQIPVSLREDIVVTLEESSKASYNEKTGELRWDMLIERNSTEEKVFIYEVKYPKDENIILE